MLDKVASGALWIAPTGRSGDRLRFAAPYLKALTIYLSSRLVVLLGIAFGKTYIALGNDTWPGGAQWYHRLLRWDSEGYKIIASEGYKYDGDPGLTQTVVFYPLYPSLSRLVSEVLRIDVVDSMLLVATLAAALAVLLLFKLVRERFGDRTALATVAMISFFPSSIFLSAGYTESLALLLMVLFFLAVARASQHLRSQPVPPASCCFRCCYGNCGAAGRRNGS
ncbi:MAG: mannosyltransferase family protein [Bradyrhizobium sp.]